MAADRLGGLAGRSILVLGAGDMGEGMVRALVSGGVADVRIANRTWDRSVDLADRVGGAAVRLAELNQAMAEVDLLLTGTGASSLMLEHGDLSRVMDHRQGRPLLVVDVAVPRDVDPAAADVPGVTLLDMGRPAGLRRAGRGRPPGRGRVGGGPWWTRSWTATPSPPPPARWRPWWGRCTPAARRSAPPSSSGSGPASATSTIGSWRRWRPSPRGSWPKLLHDPTVALKDSAGSPKGERLADGLRDLFGL